MQNSAARSSIDVGSVIADTYTVEALIGRGGMGAVFLASHKRLAGKKVAIKVLHAELAGEEILKRFEREAQIASKLGHPNIVAVHDFNALPDGTPYLVLEYLEGESLAQRIARGPLSLDQALSITRQVGSALAAAHREGIVHRDLKPQNIFVVPTEVAGRQLEVAKVLDFGISKIRGSQTVKTQDSTMLGTPQYMAPEQATGQQSAVDERTDVFAFGAIVYEMLCGTPAFEGENVPQVVFRVVYEQPVPLEQRVPGLPPNVAAAVARAMAKEPAARWQTAAAFVEALTGEPLTLRGPVPALPSTSPRANSSDDAFAQTMDSGQHGESPLAVATAPNATGLDRTPPRDAAAEPGSTSARGAAAPAPAPGPAAPARRPRLGLWIGGGVAIAALGALTMFLVMRSHRTKHGHGARREHAAVMQGPASDEHAATPAGGASGIEVGAGSAGGSAVAGSAATREHVATTEPAHEHAGSATAHPSPAAEHGGAHGPHAHAKPGDGKHEAGSGDEAKDGPEDETQGQHLRDAETALHEGQLERAERLANGVIQAGESSRSQRLHAHVIRGIANCQQHDQEQAAIDLRALRGSPVMRARLTVACKRVGIPL